MDVKKTGQFTISNLVSHQNPLLKDGQVVGSGGLNCDKFDPNFLLFVSLFANLFAKGIHLVRRIDLGQQIEGLHHT